MGDTKIEWTATYNPDGSITPGKTWNPVRGCSRVSEGCRNCYAERVATRFSGPVKSRSGNPAEWGEKPGPFHGFAHIVNGHPAWTGKVELVEKHLHDPLKWKQPCKIFVNSMSDLFHEALQDEAIDRVFAVMALCPQHTFQILTKRPQRMLEYFTQETSPYFYACTRVEKEARRIASDRCMNQCTVEAGWPLPNVWAGVSCENQETADERIPVLRQTPAALRFISQEPQIDYIEWAPGALAGISWLIQGGESGPGARPFDLKWTVSTKAACELAGVAYFLKQLGANPIDTRPEYWQRRMRIGDGNSEYNRYIKVILKDRKGGDWSEWPEDSRVREFPAQ